MQGAAARQARLLPRVFPLLALAGLLVGLLLYRESFREASIDLSVGRAEAERRALEFLAGQGAETAGRWRSTSFQTDTTAQDYVIASSGMAELQVLAARDLGLAGWRVRVFAPLDPEEWTVDVSSRSGRILGFQHTVKEEAPGAALPTDAAERMALDALAARPGGGPAPSELRLLARRVTRQPNRTDQTFTWERPALMRGEATYRYSVTVQGGQVGSISEFYNIPESWKRLARWHFRRGALVNTIGWTATYALMAGLGLAWLWAAGRGLLRVRLAATLLAAIGVVGAATALNSVPLALAALPTDVSVPAYLADQLLQYAGLGVTLGATVVIAGMAGEALAAGEASGEGREARGSQQSAVGREAFFYQLRSATPKKFSSGSTYRLSEALTPRGLASAPVVRALLVGMCVGVAQLGYITLFYWAGARWFGVWSPVEPTYDDALSTPLPWLYAMALGLLPAIGEELVFRLGGISLLRRLTGMIRLPVVLTAVVWASLHTTYSQQPFFIRMVELTVVGIIYGALFLRYGVLASMAAHYTYNAALMAPLLIQGSWATQAGAVVAIGGAGLLLLPALARRARGLGLTQAGSETQDERRWTIDDGRWKVDQSSIVYRPSSAAVPTRWLLAASLAGALIWLLALRRLPQPPLLDRTETRADALQQAEAAARELGLPTAGLYGAAYPDATLVNLDTDYLRDHLGAQSAAETVATEGQRALWWVRWSEWDRDDTLTLRLDARGELLAFDRSLPEDAPGAAIPQAQARRMAEALLPRFDTDAALVESSTITRTNRVDHRFVWESPRVVGEAGRPRVMVTVQGDQVASLTPFLFTPPEYRRQRDRATLARSLARDAIPSLPDVVALLLSGACLILALRRPAPLRLMIGAGLAGAGLAFLSGLLRLDAAQIAQPPRLVQGVTYAAYAAILSGAGLALVAGGAALLWRRAFPELAPLEEQLARLGRRRWTMDDRRWAMEESSAVYRPSSARVREKGWRWPEVRKLALALVPALLAFGALRAGLAAAPGAVRSPGGLASLAPGPAVLIQGALSALHSALLLAGGAALLASWRPLRRYAVPLAALAAVLVAAQPDRPALLALALLAWPAALLLARLLRGNVLVLAAALWFATCLPDALGLLALAQPWYAANGALAIVALAGAALLGAGARR